MDASESRFKFGFNLVCIQPGAGKAEVKRMRYSSSVVNGALDFEPNGVRDGDFDSHDVSPICK
jgi:hypothetical protein